MKKKLHVGHSPLSNAIYCGSLIEKGTCWGANKTDVTEEALGAVLDHCMQHERRTGDKVILTGGGKKFTINIDVTEVTQ